MSQIIHEANKLIIITVFFKETASRGRLRIVSRLGRLFSFQIIRDFTLFEIVNMGVVGISLGGQEGE